MNIDPKNFSESTGSKLDSPNAVMSNEVSTNKVVSNDGSTNKVVSNDDSSLDAQVPLKEVNKDSVKEGFKALHEGVEQTNFGVNSQDKDEKEYYVIHDGTIPPRIIPRGIPFEFSTHKE